MSVVSSRFIINFKANGVNQLRTVRSEIKGIQQQSYISLNQASRNMNAFERSSVKSLNNIDKSLKRLNLSFKYGVLSLGAIGTGAFIAGVNGLARAFIHTNTQIQTSKIMIEELIGSRGKAKEFISVMQDMASTFGHDMSEVMTSSRGIMQVMRNIGQPEAKNFKEILKITMALSAMDTENRGLSYYAYSMKETMQGQGMIDFTSLARRLEVTFSKAAKTGMVKAAKEGNMNEFVKLMKAEFKRIGVDPDTLLSRMTKESFMVNVNRLQSYTTMAFQKAGEKGFYALTEPLSKFAEYISKNMSESGWIGKALGRLSYTISDKMQPFIEVLNQMGSDALTKRFEIMDAFVYSIANNLKGAKDFFGMFGAFAHGATGTSIDSYFGVNGLLGGLNSFSNLGNKISYISNELTPSIYGLGQAFHYLGTQLGALTGGGMGALSLMKGLVNSISTAVTGLGALARVASLPKQAGTQIGGEGSWQETAGTVASVTMAGLMLASSMKGGRQWMKDKFVKKPTTPEESLNNSNFMRSHPAKHRIMATDRKIEELNNLRNTQASEEIKLLTDKRNSAKQFKSVERQIKSLEKQKKTLEQTLANGGKWGGFTMATREERIKLANVEEKLAKLQSKKIDVEANKKSFEYRYESFKKNKTDYDPLISSATQKRASMEGNLDDSLLKSRGMMYGFGNALVGARTKLTEGYKSFKLSDHIGDITQMGFLGVLLTQIGTTLMPLFTKLGNILKPLWTGFVALSARAGIFAGVLGFLTSGIGLTVLAVGAMATAIWKWTDVVIAHRQEEENALKITQEKNATENQQRLQRVLRGAGMISGASQIKSTLDQRMLNADGTLESSQNFLNRIAPNDRKPFMNLLEAIHKGEISQNDQARMFGDANSAWMRGLQAEYNPKTNEIKMISVEPESLIFLAKKIAEDREKLQLKYEKDNSFTSADSNGKGTGVVF